MTVETPWPPTECGKCKKGDTLLIPCRLETGPSIGEARMGAVGSQVICGYLCPVCNTTWGATTPERRDMVLAAIGRAAGDGEHAAETWDAERGRPHAFFSRMLAPSDEGGPGGLGIGRKLLNGALKTAAAKKATRRRR